MKIFKVMFVCLLAAGGAFGVRAQQPDIVGAQPGILLSGTASVKSVDLPSKAKDFIKKYFKYQRVASCQQEVPSGNYNVVLGDGKELTFDRKGQWLSVDARIDSNLPSALVRRLLPDRAYREVVRDGYQDRIYSLSRNGKGHYTIDVDQAVFDEMVFDGGGTLLAFHY